MKRLQYALFLAMAFLLIGCTANNNLKYEPRSNDTIYTAKAALEIFDYNPERALLIIDSAEIVGNITHDRASYLRAKVFTMTLNGLYLDSAQKICLSLVHSDYIKNPDNHESVLDLLVSISRRKQDFEQWLVWSTEKVDFCRKYDNEVEALRTEAEVGVILTYLGRHDEGLQKLDDVIEQLDQTRKFSEMDACIIALRRKVDVLQQLELYDEIIPVAHKIIEKINDYEQNTSDYHDGSYREPRAEKLSDYCDFYRVKAYAYLARAYTETNDIANARHYLSLFENSRYGNTFDGRMMISMTWCKLGDYDKMLAIYDEVENYLKDDTINETYSMILRNRAIAAESRGKYTQAYDYIKRHAELSQLINNQFQESKANEFAAKYRAREQQMEIEWQTKKNRLQNFIILAMFIALLVSVFFYNHTVYKKKQLARKNAALVRLIDEKTKQNPSQNDARLSEACKMISEHPEMTTAEIAKAVGFSVPNLHKLFREQYGISLTEYKVSHQK